MTRIVAAELLADYSSKNAQIQEKCFKPWRLNTALLLCYFLAGKLQGSFSGFKKRNKKIGHFVNRLGNGKTIRSMLEANREKTVGGSKKRNSYQGY